MNKRQNYILHNINNWKYYFRNKMTLEDIIINNKQEALEFVNNKYNIVDLEDHLKIHQDDEVIKRIEVLL